MTKVSVSLNIFNLISQGQIRTSNQICGAVVLFKNGLVLDVNLLFR